MRTDEFNIVLDRRLELIRSVLGSKAKEYAHDTDRLHNFNRAAKMFSTTPEKALVGMLAKHWVSVMDMVDDPGTIRSKEYIEEKFGDTINYLILLEAMVKDQNSFIDGVS